MTAAALAGSSRIGRSRLDMMFDGLQHAIASGTAFDPPPPHGPPDRIDSLTEIFALEPADRALLLIAAADAIRPAALAGHRPTGALARAIGIDDVWGALCPQRPLRLWRLVEPESAGPLVERPLRADERIVHHLLGTDYLDARLDGLVDLPPAAPEASEEERRIAAGLGGMWRAEAATGWPVLQLCGPGLERKRAIAALLADPRGQRLFRIARTDVPRAAHERLMLARLCDRELALSNGVLLIEGDDAGEDEARAAIRFVDLLTGPVIVAATEPLALDRRRRIRADMPAATVHERQALWSNALGAAAHAIGTDAIDRISEQFSLDEAGIRAAAAIAADAAAGNGVQTDRLWDAARAQARRRMDDLAERTDTLATWDDLVLPPDRIEQLRQIAVHVRRAYQVHQRWGWSGRSARGLGVTALFAGPSGTGKTMAAEVIANELRLDLYRIDLSQVVSKYIGETEKNLRRIFEAAEAGGAILLFDEADALFGKRSEVKDSHDRYANVEISYLLQRMEAYRGLAILTTNLKSALDLAFMRRLRFVIDFPFPDAALRSEIWRRIFPTATPVDGIDPARLARLGVAGGTIRTIAINAAFLAAEAGEDVTQAHILAAARREYAKLDKPVTTAEFGAGA